MEVAGVVIGAVGMTALYSTCMEILDKYDSYRNFDTETRYLNDQFEADKLLLRRWAHAVGIAARDDDPTFSQATVNDDWGEKMGNQEVVTVTKAIFLDIINVFGDIESSLKKMGVVYKQTGGSKQQLTKDLATTPKLPGKIQKLRWTLSSKIKLAEKSKQFESLLSRLYKLLPIEKNAIPEHGKLVRVYMGGDEDIKLDDILLNAEKAAQRIDMEMKQDIDQWLSPKWMHQTLDNISRQKLVGTCDWMLTKNEFTSWVSEDFVGDSTKFLWINGGPGSGKSFLGASIIKHLIGSLQASTAYFFISSNAETSEDPFDVLRSWVAQLAYANDDCRLSLQRAWEVADAPTATLTEVIELFPSVVEASPNCILILDGLDEIWSSKQDTRRDFLQFLHESLAHKRSRVLVISRDVADIRAGCQYCPTRGGTSNAEYSIKLEDVRPDIERFSRALVENKLKNKKEDDKIGLAAKLADKSSGMFLWVKLQGPRLSGGKSKKMLEKLIAQTPEGLDEVYDQNWSRICERDERDRHRAVSILRWATFSFRPLKITELAVALAVPGDDDTDELEEDELPDCIDDDFIQDEIINIAGDLVEVRAIDSSGALGDRTVHLVHFSVKEFLMARLFAVSLAPSVSSVSITTIHNTSAPNTTSSKKYTRPATERAQHNILAVTCLHYLNIHDVWSNPTQSTFLRYAADCWHGHTFKGTDNYDRALRMINRLFHPENSNWHLWVQKHGQLGMASTPLYYAAGMGLIDTMQYLIRDVGVNLHVADGLLGSALGSACYYNQAEATELLLSHGATDIDNTASQSPMVLANNSVEYFVVDIMLKHPNLDQNALQTGRDLITTALQGDVNDLIELLLTLGTQSLSILPGNLSHDIINLAVQAASLKGRLNCLAILVEAGGSTNSTDRFGLTALMMASWAGHEDVCIFLLDAKTNPDQRDNAGFTAMHHAVLGDHHKIVRLLLRHGADGTIKTNDGTSCVTLASQIQATQSMKALSGVALKTGMSDIATLFNASAYHGKIEILKSLIEDTKFDPNVQDIMGRNASHLAALGGHLDALLYLQSQGTRLEALDKMGRGIIEYAAMGSDLAVVDKVLELVMPSAAQAEGTWSPLHWACRLGDVGVVRKLLEYGFKPSTVPTTEPKHLWHPLDIADYSDNMGLLESSAFQDKLGPRSPNVPQVSPDQKYTAFSCDACEQTIFGPRFHLSGQDFDYCFMCNVTRHLLHSPEDVFEVL